MSLSNLRKSKQSDRPRLVTVDEFIDDAVDYASGNGGQFSKPHNLTLLDSEKDPATRMRRATFTLTSETLEALSDLSNRTGIAKSRLIRILITEQIQRASDQALTGSKSR